MGVAEAPMRQLAATWRRADDQVVGTTFGGTMCWNPARPGVLRIESGGYLHITRCRNCPGCCEFERRRLAGRLSERYQMHHSAPSCTTAKRSLRIRSSGATTPSPLFLVRITAPRERHAAIAHALHRRPRLELEPGMFRLGTESFGLLARAAEEIKLALHRLKLEHRVEPIHLSRRRRAWHALTQGMLVSRESYGEDLNRFYARGLPPAERKSWEVIKLKAHARYDRRSSPRAWTVDNLVLVPPELWQLGRGARKNIMRQLAREHSPEGVARVMAIVADVAANVGRPLPVTAPPQAALTRQQVLEFYQRQAERKQAARTEMSAAASDPPSSEKGGYATSVHSSGSGPPPDEWLKSDREAKRRLLERDKTSFEEWAKRMAEKARERGR